MCDPVNLQGFKQTLSDRLRGSHALHVSGAIACVLTHYFTGLLYYLTLTCTSLVLHARRPTCIMHIFAIVSNTVKMLFLHNFSSF